LAELDDIDLNLNISLVKSEKRDKAGVDAATLANNWGIGLLMTTYGSPISPLIRLLFPS
jgi:hypothetical protein